MLYRRSTLNLPRSTLTPVDQQLPPTTTITTNSNNSNIVGASQGPRSGNHKSHRPYQPPQRQLLTVSNPHRSIRNLNAICPQLTASTFFGSSPLGESKTETNFAKPKKSFRTCTVEPRYTAHFCTCAPVQHVPAHLCSMYLHTCAACTQSCGGTLASCRIRFP
jgi:hypothetical protein